MARPVTGRRRVVVASGAMAATLLVALALLVVFRQSSDDTEGSPGPDGSPTTTETEVPGFRFLPEDATGPGPPAPLTGLPVEDRRLLDRPSLAVKVDNLDVPGETARPQSGLAHADVVVEELVEGGITRFVLLAHSTDSPDIGPIRSARTTDVHLLPAFGAPLFAYSGGNPGVLAAVRAAPSIIDRGGEAAPAYARVPDRRPPHDLFLRPEEVWDVPGEATPPRRLADFLEVGRSTTAGDEVDGVAIEYPGTSASTIRWEWLGPARRWVRYQRDALHVDSAGYAVSPRNVVVVFTDHDASPADPRSPEAVSVGSGEAWMLIGGRAVVGRWERPDEQDPMTFVDDAGDPVALTPGRTWIELVPPGRARLLP